MTNPFSLNGRTILVTGASSGIGRATAIAAATMGAVVIATGRNVERLNETLARLEGSGHRAIVADLTCEDQLNAMVTQLPPLNGVVFSTGISQIKPVRFLNQDDITANFSVGFDAPVKLTAALLAAKKIVARKCSLVFVSSISLKYPFVGGSMYVAVKGALENFARALALEMAPKGIRVNCVAPAFVKGPMLDQTEAATNAETIRQIEARQPLGIGEPEDVANAIVFYLSDAARWVSGTSLIMGGG